VSGGTILIEGLTVHCIVGVLPAERCAPQRLLVDAEVDLDFAAAAAQDDVAATLDYARAADLLTRLAVEGRFQLVETYVSRACDALLGMHPGAMRVCVSARKPDILPQCRAVGARLERRR
jgi:7,8-dihydroneopterin aldolase/epimerase/oxygenase